ncbi:MAG: RNA pseudouridine synthase [Bacteroidetes bacterium]|jgi:23S rRNA pseudouridine1911/1915/1917 synthase|nr:RNA pseudouridine synthase [Bacteroidota bacterium]
MEEPKVIFEDNHLLAVNKGSGWLVQSDRTGDFTLLEWAKRYIKDRYNKPGKVFLNPVHRIDRPASGAVLFGRTTKGLSRMNQLIKERKIDKFYWAITHTAPPQPSATIEHYILKEKKKNKVTAIPLNKRAPKKAKKATLSFDLTAEIEGRFLVRINLQTGRPHQIRSQLAAIGCSIIGDIKYGAPEPLADQSIALHSAEMNFIHPVRNNEVKIIADPPQSQVWTRFKSFF